jgi:hypothetical protein
MDDNSMYSDDRPTRPAKTAPASQASQTRRTRLIAGTAAASVLAAGAAFGAVTVFGSGSPASASASPSGQAAVLNSALSSAAAPATTAGTAARHRFRHPLLRLRRLGIDGQFTFETKAGPKTLAFERGTVQSVSGSDVVIKAKDGTTWTWVLVADSVVRQDGKKTTASALSAGEHVFAGGPVVKGTHDARLIIIRPAKKSASSPSSSTSSSASGTSTN